jgi:hypothetical protein
LIEATGHSRVDEANCTNPAKAGEASASINFVASRRATRALSSEVPALKVILLRAKTVLAEI